MSVIKCKMCGGDLNLVEGSSVAVCEYCGSQQTVPAADNEKKLTLFARANRLRLACEFDKAAGVYESIVADFPTEAEAYWGLVLCRYGIEYVDDPATGKKIPTCHRSSFDSVMEDSDFEQALENADAVARRVYRDEAKAIEELRRGIVEVSGKEPPYDIFICYKETAEDGQRTVDSVIAQDVYDALTEKGYRVFFSRISLEAKLGTEYEPYIFAALHSAKIMLAFGTDYEYYNAVWVKNEWSRYLQLMTRDKSKHLIPCYKGIDAYDMPKEFAKLQAQDMGKVGAMQDLLRGVDKIMGRDRVAPAPAADPAVVPAPAANPTVTSLLERAEMFLEDGDWDSADEYCEKVLDIEPKNGTAYFYKLLVGLKVRSKDDLASQRGAFDNHKRYKAALEYATDEQAAFLRECNNAIRYRNASRDLEWARIPEEYRKAAESFKKIPGYKDADECVQKAEKKASEAEVNFHMLKPKRTAIAPYQGVLAASNDHTIGVKAGGTVVAVGDNSNGECNISDWQEIVATASGWEHTVGLKMDGTVVAVGNNKNGQCNVSGWQGIVAIAAGKFHTVGLKSDGTVVCVGYNEDGGCDIISSWKDIVSIAVGQNCTVGLKRNGTVDILVHNLLYGHAYCNSSAIFNIIWNEDRDIVAIAASSKSTTFAADRKERVVALKSDGTVLTATGNRDTSDSDVLLSLVYRWDCIVAIAAGANHVVGLKSDGTVLAVGNNEYGQCNVSDWRDIIAIAAGTHHTVGLKSDGTVVAAGDNEKGQCNVGDWKLICTEEDLAALKNTKRASLTAEKTTLQTELSNLKGLFSGKRRKEVESRLAEIEKELVSLREER